MGPNPTEPANYRGSNTRGAKEIVDIEITMYRNTGIIVLIPRTITIGFVTTLATMLGQLKKLTVYEEEQEGGLRN